ncbi:hypothetical protein D3C80_1961140 [compost metagenome]
MAALSCGAPPTRARLPKVLLNNFFIFTAARALCGLAAHLTNGREQLLGLAPLTLRITNYP